MNKVYLDPNTKYSDQYAMLAKMPDIVDELNEVADKAEQVPDPAVANIGKVLGIVSDGASGAEYGAVEQSSGLPTISAGDAGKVLTVNAGETGAEWDSVDALPAIGSGDAGKVLTVNAGETGAEWATPSGGGSATYRILADWDYEHAITVPPADAVALPSGAVWQVDPNTTFDHYLVDGQGTALTADDIQDIKIGDIILEQPCDEYYDDSYTKSLVLGIMDYNGFDSDGNAKCLRFVYYSSLQGYGYGTVGYSFHYEAPING